MKHTIYLLACLILSSVVVSCASDDDMDYKSDFETSKTAWNDFKAASNNSYIYVTYGGSVFTSYGWETTITVSDGIIIQRDFKFTAGAEEHIPLVDLEWTEHENEINSPEHDYTSATVARTLDEVYNISEHDWLLKRTDATSYFEAENQGLISTSGYVKKSCQDDCFVGITIKSIEAL
ncbi:hypothetical protein [Formosa sp. 4Alg 33]|uniref:hypothetical protein n=1 Tax=Formosa sp. 4Alg 33 TaxID=3382189 RepID=UPI003D9C56B1